MALVEEIVLFYKYDKRIASCVALGTCFRVIQASRAPKEPQELPSTNVYS